MHIPSIVLALSTTTSAVYLKTYAEPHCRGTAREVNVYDNTCADWPDSFTSFSVGVYGARDQVAFFMPASNCGNLYSRIKAYKVDTSLDAVNLNSCQSFSDNQTAFAVASYNGPAIRMLFAFTSGVTFTGVKRPDDF